MKQSGTLLRSSPRGYGKKTIMALGGKIDFQIRKHGALSAKKCARNYAPEKICNNIAEIITSVVICFARLAALVKSLTALMTVLDKVRKKPKKKQNEGFRILGLFENPLPQTFSADGLIEGIMKYKSIVSTVFTLGTAASASFARPAAQTC